MNTQQQSELKVFSSRGTRRVARKMDEKNHLAEMSMPMSEMEKNWGVTDFVFEIKRVKNYPNFDKSALVTRHGLSAC